MESNKFFPNASVKHNFESGDHPDKCRHCGMHVSAYIHTFNTLKPAPREGLIAATRSELGTAPAHYSKGKHTPWEIIDDWKLDYYCGNALKYVCRHLHKGKPVEDIQKAIDCLIKYRDNLKKEMGL